MLNWVNCNSADDISSELGAPAEIHMFYQKAKKSEQYKGICLAKEILRDRKKKIKFF